MICFTVVAFLLCNTILSDAVTVNIKGVIDLGPQWNYYYRVFSSNNSKVNTRTTRAQEATLVNRNNIVENNDKPLDSSTSIEAHLQDEHLKQSEGTRGTSKGLPENDDSSNSEPIKSHFIRIPLNLQSLKSNDSYINTDDLGDKLKDRTKKHALTTKEFLKEIVKFNEFTSAENYMQQRGHLKHTEEPLRVINKSPIHQNEADSSGFITDVTAKHTKAKKPSIKREQLKNKPKSVDESLEEFVIDVNGNRIKDKKLNQDFNEPLRDRFNPIQESRLDIEEPLSGVSYDPVGDNKPNINTISKDHPKTLIKNNKNKPNTILKKTQLNDPTTVKKFINMDIFIEPIKIKDNDNLNNFMIHIYNQTQNIFETIRSSSDDHEIKRQIHFLNKSYQDKFSEFTKDTLHQHIRTKLGSQKVMLNAIDVSKTILMRLVNFLMSDMEKRGILRDSSATVNLFIKEIEKGADQEYAYVCNKYGICRSRTGVTEYMSLVIGELLKVDDTKLMLAINSFTEALKSTDFSKTFDKETMLKLNVSIKKVEKADVNSIRALLFMVNNVLKSKNKPFVIRHKVQPRVKLTIAILELLDTLESASLAKEHKQIRMMGQDNNNFLDNLKLWEAGYVTNMVTVSETALKQVKAFLRSLDHDSLTTIRQLVNKVLGYFVHEDEIIMKGFTRD